jgi:hypothetical protein
MKGVIMKKIGIILDNGCCRPEKDYRIFDYESAVYNNKWVLLSQQGYRTIKDALQDAKIMNISIIRSIQLLERR